MSVITLDAETFYRSKKDRTTPGPRYSLSGSTGKTYEMYIRDPEFKVHGMGVQIDRARPDLDHRAHRRTAGRDLHPR